MVHEQGRPDRRQVLLAVVVAGGAAVAGMGAPQFIHHGGHTGAEYVFMGAQLVGPVVFLIAGVIAFVVYRFGRSVMHHALLAAITAVLVGGVCLAVATPTWGLATVFVTIDGSYVAAAAVFVSLVVTVAISRHRRGVRAAREAAAAETGSTISAPRMPLGVVVLLAGIAAGVPVVVVSIVKSFEFLSDPLNGGFLPGLLLGALLSAVSIGLVAGWAVLVVLLVDQWVAPRLVRALGAGAFAAAALAVPSLVIGGGLEYGGEAAGWGLVSGVAAAAVVALSERRVVPAAVAGLGDAVEEEPLSLP